MFWKMHGGAIPKKQANEKQKQRQGAYGNPKGFPGGMIRDYNFMAPGIQRESHKAGVYSLYGNWFPVYPSLISVPVRVGSDKVAALHTGNIPFQEMAAFPLLEFGSFCRGVAPLGGIHYPELKFRQQVFARF